MMKNYLTGKITGFDFTTKYFAKGINPTTNKEWKHAFVNIEYYAHSWDKQPSKRKFDLWNHEAEKLITEGFEGRFLEASFDIKKSQDKRTNEWKDDFVITQLSWIDRNEVVNNKINNGEIADITSEQSDDSILWE